MITRECTNCGTAFDIPWKGYNKTTCGAECARASSSKRQRGQIRTTYYPCQCIVCGKEFSVRQSTVDKAQERGCAYGVYCSRECQRKGYVGEGNPKWRGGRYKTGQGHVLVYCPDHPNAVKGMVMEHRLVMERHIGRYRRREEVVHHINEVKDDNRIENLQLCANASEHRIAHGHRKTFFCDNCGAAFERKAGEVNNHKKNGYKNMFCSRKCGSIFQLSKINIKSQVA